MTSLLVLDPTNGVATTTTELVARPSSFAGLRVGYLDNTKPNSDRFLDILAATLAAHGVSAAIHERKAYVGRLAEPSQLDDLAARCDVVITGVGDCAGCCSCSVQDGIALEKRGIPTFVICTSELLTTAVIAASTVGVPDYPFVVIDHPFGALGVPELRERVAVAHEQIKAQLVDE
ncbi:MAG: UGSC family (seleno)protein [Actinophytocola sp.]|uniref:UGSC family (seleno)protein n=1 Tax=Actinophytocola sp. TaxID=1872138 RepID=UPI003C714742